EADRIETAIRHVNLPGSYREIARGKLPRRWRPPPDISVTPRFRGTSPQPASCTFALSPHLRHVGPGGFGWLASLVLSAGFRPPILHCPARRTTVRRCFLNRSYD